MGKFKKKKKKREPKELFNCQFFSLFDDGTIGCSDGVGSVGGIESGEVKELYEVLKELYNEDNYQ